MQLRLRQIAQLTKPILVMSRSSMPFVAQSRRNVFNFSLALPVSHNRTGHGQSTRPSKANQDVADENEQRAQRDFSPPVCAPLGFCVRLELILIVAIMVSPAKQPGCGKGRSSRQCFDDRELKRQKSRRKCSGSWEASSLSRNKVMRDIDLYLPNGPPCLVRVAPTDIVPATLRFLQRNPGRGVRNHAP